MFISIIPILCLLYIFLWDNEDAEPLLLKKKQIVSHQG